MPTKKTIDNTPCLTPCYPAYQKYIHPLSFEVEYHNQPSCASYPIFDTELGELVSSVPCQLDKDSVSGSSVSESVHIDLFTVSIPYKPLLFLSEVYQIHNITDYYSYLANNSLEQVEALDRIVSMAWKGYCIPYGDVTDAWINEHRKWLLKTTEIDLSEGQFYHLYKDMYLIVEKWNKINLAAAVRKLAIKYVNE